MAEYNLGENLGLPEIPKTSIMQYREPYLDLFQIFIAIRRLAAYITGGGAVPEAPVDGKLYGRKDAAWSEVPATLPDAPSDGKTYGRKNAAWAEVTGGGGSGVNYIVDAIYGFHPGFKAQSTSVQGQTGVNNARGSIVIVPYAGKFKVGWRCVAFTTGTAVRAGLYNRRATNSWLPGTLAIDLGTLTITATGLALTGTSVTIPQGVYMLVIFYGTNAGTSNTYVYNTCDPAAVIDALPEPLYSAGNPPTRYDFAVTYPTGTLPDLTATSGTVQTAAQAIGPRLIGAA